MSDLQETPQDSEPVVESTSAAPAQPSVTSTETLNVTPQAQAQEQEAATTQDTFVDMQAEIQATVARMLAENEEKRQSEQNALNTKIDALKAMGITEGAEAVARQYGDIEAMKESIKAIRSNILKEGEANTKQEAPQNASPRQVFSMPEMWRTRKKD